MSLKGWPRGRVAITPYDGYQRPGGAVLRGRVLAVRDRPKQSRLRNAITFLRLFMTDEVAVQRLRISGTALTTSSDEEGCFSLMIPDAPGQGAAQVSISVEGDDGRTPIRVSPRPDQAQQGVISDIDDMMMYTGAWSLWLNLWNSVTGGRLARHVFPEAVALMTRLAGGGRSPVFHVSSQP